MTHVRHWRVYDHELAILEIADQPGPLTSTAPRPPGSTPPMHPFLTATALDAGHEDQLRQLLERARTSDEFVRALQDAGYRVAPE